MRRVLKWVGQKLGISWLTARIRDMAEGRLGPKWQALYVALAGRKTWTGLALAGVVVALDALELTAASGWMLPIAVVLVSTGLLDKAWRHELPQTPRESRIYQVLARFSPELTVALGAAWGAVELGHCGGVDCAVASRVLLVAGALFAHLGLIDTAWRTPGPRIGPRIGAEK